MADLVAEWKEIQSAQEVNGCGKYENDTCSGGPSDELGTAQIAVLPVWHESHPLRKAEVAVVESDSALLEARERASIALRYGSEKVLCPSKLCTKYCNVISLI